MRTRPIDASRLVPAAFTRQTIAESRRCVVAQAAVSETRLTALTGEPVFFGLCVPWGHAGRLVETGSTRRCFSSDRRGMLVRPVRPQGLRLQGSRSLRSVDPSSYRWPAARPDAASSSLPAESLLRPINQHSHRPDCDRGLQSDAAEPPAPRWGDSPAQECPPSTSSGGGSWSPRIGLTQELLGKSSTS